MKQCNGKPFKIKNDIVGKIAKKKLPLLNRKNRIIAINDDESGLFGYKAIIFKRKIEKHSFIPIPQLTNVSSVFIDSISDGDIALLNRDGICQILWEKDSQQNCILITEECNCRCWMCPQPPMQDNKKQDILNRTIFKLLDKSSTREICITGGEPTLYSDRLIDYLQIIKNNFPDVNVTILTNGKNLNEFNLVKRIVDVGVSNLIFCISLHADTDTVHDSICRSKGSFVQTINGILNLAKFRQKIEIRYVINKMNHHRLKSFSHFIYKNLPFVIHIAFMGLEISGYAKKNFDKIWVDPTVFKKNLMSATLDLYKKGLNPSIYNLPLCLLQKEIWQFSRKSISKWKNSYLEQCNACSEKENCCGIFTTSSFNSPFITAIT